MPYLLLFSRATHLPSAQFIGDGWILDLSKLNLLLPHLEKEPKIVIEAFRNAKMVGREGEDEEVEEGDEWIFSLFFHLFFNFDFPPSIPCTHTHIYIYAGKQAQTGRLPAT